MLRSPAGLLAAIMFILPAVGCSVPELPEVSVPHPGTAILALEVSPAGLICRDFVAVDAVTGEVVLSAGIDNAELVDGEAQLLLSLDEGSYNLHGQLLCVDQTGADRVIDGSTEAFTVAGPWAVTWTFLSLAPRPGPHPVTLRICAGASIVSASPSLSCAGPDKLTTVTVVVDEHASDCALELALTLGDDSHDFGVIASDTTELGTTLAIPEVPGIHAVELRARVGDDDFGVISTVDISVVDCGEPQPPAETCDLTVASGFNLGCAATNGGETTMLFGAYDDDIALLSAFFEVDPTYASLDVAEPLDILDAAGLAGSSFLQATPSDGVLSVVISPDLLGGAQIEKIVAGEWLRLHTTVLPGAPAVVPVRVHGVATKFDGETLVDEPFDVTFDVEVGL